MPPPVLSGLDASPWPLYRGNLLRTGREAGSGPSLAPGLLQPRVDWTFFPNQSYGAPRAAAAPVLSSPAIGADGSIYYGSLDGYVYALFADGAARLVFASALSLGRVHSAERCALARTSQTGSFKWRYKAGAPVAASPCVGNRIGALLRLLAALATAALTVSLTPLPGSDSTVYVAAYDGTIHAARARCLSV